MMIMVTVAVTVVVVAVVAVVVMVAIVVLVSRGGFYDLYHRTRSYIRTSIASIAYDAIRLTGIVYTPQSGQSTSGTAAVHTARKRDV